MMRVALHLGRPAFPTFYDEAGAEAAKDHRRCVERCDPGRDLRRPRRVRQDAFTRRFDARAESGDGSAGTEHAQEVAAGHTSGIIDRAVLERLPVAGHLARCLQR